MTPEAVSDAEVFSVRGFRTLDLRSLPDPLVYKLRSIMTDFARRMAGPMLEEGLIDARGGERR